MPICSKVMFSVVSICLFTGKGACPMWPLNMMHWTSLYRIHLLPNLGPTPTWVLTPLNLAFLWTLDRDPSPALAPPWPHNRLAITGEMLKNVYFSGADIWWLFTHVRDHSNLTLLLSWDEKWRIFLICLSVSHSVSLSVDKGIPHMTTTHVGFEPPPPTRHLQLVQWDFAVRGPTNLLESVRLDFD